MYNVIINKNTNARVLRKYNVRRGLSIQQGWPTQTILRAALKTLYNLVQKNCYSRITLGPETKKKISSKNLKQNDLLSLKDAIHKHNDNDHNETIENNYNLIN